MLEILGAVGSWLGCQGAPPFLPHLGGKLYSLLWDPGSPEPRSCCPLSWPLLVVPTGHEHLRHCPMSCAEVAALWHSWRGRWAPWPGSRHLLS